MKEKTITVKQVEQKLKQYCAYQERCHAEVKEKLYGFGLHRQEVEDIICTLIADNYLNEERFAIQFAGGKFRVKKWGKRKISYELKSKQISAYCIKKALQAIDETDYFKTAQTLLEAKQRLLGTSGNVLVRKKKLQDYLYMKGYESVLIYDLLKGIK
ncbi:MAG: regulatory protein RecX [Ferruginibacter sp.]